MFSRRKALSLLTLGGVASLVGTQPKPAEAATTVPVQGQGVNLIRVLTQAQYDALLNKPATTLFIIRG